MIDLFEELKTITARFEGEGIEYGLAGGLAMAVHGLVRATVDIDLLVRPDDLGRALDVARDLGYVLPAGSMTFAGGKVKMHRVGKPDADAGDVVNLDLILAGKDLAEAWNSRIAVEWEGGRMRVVSRQGLVFLKSLRGSGTDRDDIAFLEGAHDEA